MLNELVACCPFPDLISNGCDAWPCNPGKASCSQLDVGHTAQGLDQKEISGLGVEGEIENTLLPPVSAMLPVTRVDTPSLWIFLSL